MKILTLFCTLILSWSAAAGTNYFDTINATHQGDGSALTGLTNSVSFTNDARVHTAPQWLATTNASFFPDFAFAYSMTNVGASYTLGAPLNQTSGKTRVETTVFIIKTNGVGSSPWTLTSPSGVTTTGVAFVTNQTVVTVFVYGSVFTNYNYFPVN